jgi:hypothetical protein
LWPAHSRSANGAQRLLDDMLPRAGRA